MNHALIIIITLVTFSTMCALWAAAFCCQKTWDGLAARPIMWLAGVLGALQIANLLLIITTP
jgi:hypothetical protein